jgi:hypothetical protein
MANGWVERAKWVRPGGGITGHHEVVTDAMLDRLAERFQEHQIGQITGCTFEQYVCDHRSWDLIAALLPKGWGISFNPALPGWVTLVRPSAGATVH